MSDPQAQDAPAEAEEVIERALAELAVADERDVTDHIIGTLREAGFSLVHESERLTREEIEAVLALDQFDSVNWPEEDLSPPILGVKRKLQSRLASEGDG